MPTLSPTPSSTPCTPRTPEPRRLGPRVRRPGCRGQPARRGAQPADGDPGEQGPHEQIGPDPERPGHTEPLPLRCPLLLVLRVGLVRAVVAPVAHRVCAQPGLANAGPDGGQRVVGQAAVQRLGRGVREDHVRRGGEQPPRAFAVEHRHLLGDGDAGDGGRRAVIGGVVGLANRHLLLRGHQRDGHGEQQRQAEAEEDHRQVGEQGRGRGAGRDRRPAQADRADHEQHQGQQDEHHQQPGHRRPALEEGPQDERGGAAEQGQSNDPGRGELAQNDLQRGEQRGLQGGQDPGRAVAVDAGRGQRRHHQRAEGEHQEDDDPEDHPSGLGVDPGHVRGVPEIRVRRVGPEHRPSDQGREQPEQRRPHDQHGDPAAGAHPLPQFEPGHGDHAGEEALPARPGAAVRRAGEGLEDLGGHRRSWVRER